MQFPASPVPLKNIFFATTESRDRSRLGRALSWPDAEAAVILMAAVAPDRGCDKASFSIEWSDGERYEGSLEITRSMSVVPAPLSSHVRRALEFAAGRWRPGEMTEGQQRAFLAEGEVFSPGRAAWASRILDNYELGGAP